MKVLVTGGAGFVGRHVVRALNAAGHTPRILDPAPWSDAPCELLPASVTDAAAVARAIAGVDAVIHLAALTSLWVPDPRAFTRVNVEGARLVAETAAQAGVRRFVHISSATTLVGGTAPDETVTEDTRPAELAGPYPGSKRAGEAAVLATPGLDAMVLIPTLPAGPGDVNRTAPSRLIADLARGGPPAILQTWLDFVDARDLAQTIVAALTKGEPGARYLTSGHGLLLSDLALTIDRLCGRAPRPRPLVPYAVALTAARAQEAAARFTCREPQATLTGVRIAGRIRRFDSSRAARALGHAPRPLEETLRDALTDLR